MVRHITLYVHMISLVLSTFFSVLCVFLHYTYCTFLFLQSVMQYANFNPIDINMNKHLCNDLFILHNNPFDIFCILDLVNWIRTLSQAAWKLETVFYWITIWLKILLCYTLFRAGINIQFIQWIQIRFKKQMSLLEC